MASPGRKRRTWPVLLLLVAGVGGALYYFFRPPELHPAPMANVPANASAVLHLDVPAIRDGTLWRRLVVGTGRDRGLRRLEEECGFDPIGGLNAVTVFVSGEAPFALDHVGAVLAGTFDHERLGECLGEAAEATGSQLRRTDVAGLPAVAGARGDSRAVFVGRNGIVFGPEPTAIQTIATIRDGDPSADQTALGLIFRDVEGRDLTFAARIPPQWRDQLQQSVPGELGSELATMLAHLDAVAIGARMRRGLSASIRLVLDDPTAAEALGTWLRRKLDAVLDTPFIGLTPVAGALRQLAVEREGMVVTLAFDFTEERVEELLEFAQDLEGRDGGLAGALDDLGDAP